MKFNLFAKITPKDVCFLRSKLAPIIGCLRHLATPASAAARRISRDFDSDGILIGQHDVDPFLIDAQMKLEPSRALRRSARHTQIVPDPTNLHIRTRRSHTDEVAGIAVTLAMILGGNPWLCLAGALGHDIGHTPFGHTGEKFLSEHVCPSFRHEIFGCVVAQHIERSGHGLNLTKQTLRVICNHSRGAGGMDAIDMSLEEAIVMYADKIAYLFADYNDFVRLIRGGCWVDLSPQVVEAIHVAFLRLGESQRERVARCLVAFCLESAEVGCVSFSSGRTFEYFEAARHQMYKFYPSNNPSRHGFSIYRSVYEAVAEVLPDVNTAVLFALLCDDDLRALIDCVGKRPTRAIESMITEELSVADVIPHLRGRTINPFDPDLDWEGIPDASYAT